MNELVRPCRKYNSIDRAGFVVRFDAKLSVDEIVRKSTKLDGFFSNREQKKSKSGSLIGFKFYECSISPRVNLYITENGLYIYDLDYMRWQFTQKVFFEILKLVECLNDHDVIMCALGYLDKYFVQEKTQYRDIFKKNPYIPEIAYTGDMLYAYDLQMSCERSIGISDDIVNNSVCSLAISSCKNKDDIDYYAVVSLDTSITMRKKYEFLHIIKRFESISSEMHKWSKFIFNSIVEDSLLNRVGAGGE
ncbi:MAG: hypothetical protein ACOZBL_01085 [Patescibacteria group bacterium]